MKELELGTNEAGQRLDKYLFKVLPLAPKGFIYKMLRKKNIVLNGKKSDGTEITALGDRVKLFLSDETFQSFSGKEVKVKSTNIKAEVLYEDDDIIFLNKPAGVLSQKSVESDISMNEVLLEYLVDNNKITKEQLKTYKPAIVNRLDRNTSGIILAGKSLPGTQELSSAIKLRSFKKEYLCVVKGYIDKQMKLTGSLTKDNRNNKVKVSEKNDGADEIRTDIYPLAKGNNCTLLLVHLITGRTHQIRAHLSSIGHPLFGDNKYGDINLNRELEKKYSLKCQLLHAYRVSFERMDGHLTRVSNKSVIAPLPKIFERILKGEELKWQPGQDED